MRLLFVVQRYGAEVAGGAELLCREFATRMASRGHEIEVVSSCAVNYMDWANVLPAGTAEVDGVLVHRLPVAAPRRRRHFNWLNARVVWGNKRAPLHLQRRWMEAQGPYLPQLPAWLGAKSPDHDVVVFFTYLYYTTWAGLPVAATSTPTVLHPLAHDEPPLYLPLFEATFRHPTAFAFLTREEGELVARRVPIRQPKQVIGAGVDLDAGGNPEDFRAEFGLEDRPYLLFLGRVEPGKASDELFDFFVAYKHRHEDNLALVVVGDPVIPLPPHPDVFVTGFVSEEVKQSAISGAVALVQPSYFESFSMVLTEAWAQGRPALVQGRCEVLAGQARRSSGGLPYRGFAEFEAAVELLLGDRSIGDALGQAGRRYVEEHYSWDRVLERYEALLERSCDVRAVGVM